MKMLLILALLLVLVILAFGQTPVRPEAWTPDGKNVVDASRPIGHTGNPDVRAPGIDMGSALAGPPPQTAAELPARAVEKSVDVGGYNLYFRIIRGRGPAILLESGGGMNSTEWNALAPRLARETGATVIAYDRAGFGKSDLPEMEYDLREETAALWRGLRSLGLDRDIVLVGHSYGGFLIRFEAAEHPESVRGLVFVDPFTVEFVDALGIDYCDNHPMME